MHLARPLSDGKHFQVGFSDALRYDAAVLYDEAFDTKLRPAIRDDAARVAVIAAGLDPDKAIAAVDDRALLGLAGFHDEGGSLTGGITFGSVRREVGLLRAIKAFAVFALLDRQPGTSELLMDGIVVRDDARGQGIGTGLFVDLEAYALSHGMNRIRLEVVDTNPGARRLYDRLGFEPVATQRMPYLRSIMGFSASTTMVKHLGRRSGPGITSAGSPADAASGGRRPLGVSIRRHRLPVNARRDVAWRAGGCVVLCGLLRRWNPIIPTGVRELTPVMRYLQDSGWLG
jgi:GNAT superfamily N-acetyltransferase